MGDRQSGSGETVSGPKSSRFIFAAKVGLALAFNHRDMDERGGNTGSKGVDPRPQAASILFNELTEKNGFPKSSSGDAFAHPLNLYRWPGLKLLGTLKFAASAILFVNSHISILMPASAPLEMYI
jgi:hypothetical protein